MDDRQKREIRRMRLEGKGYRIIAKEIGLSRDIVRNFCKSQGLAGYADKGLVLEGKELRRDKGVCIECGKELEQPKTGRRRLFCCEDCRRGWWKRNNDQVNKKAYYKIRCLCCGKVFEVYGNKDRRYCSHECYIEDRFYKGEELKQHARREAAKRVILLKETKKREGMPPELVDSILDDVIAMLEEND